MRREAGVTPDRCLLCGEIAGRGRGIFEPNESIAKRIGQPKGKRRIVFYALCDACFGLPREPLMERVEAKLLHEMTVQ